MDATSVRGSALADLVNLSRQLHEDGEAADTALWQRDRAVAQSLTQTGSEADQLRAWLHAVGADRSAGSAVAARVALITFAAAVIGLFVGASLARWLLHYDGDHPISVVNVLLALVVLPWGLVVLLIGLALTPGLRSLGEQAGIDAGLWLALALRLAPARVREPLVQALARSRQNLVLFGRVARWVVLRWSQTFALGLSVGVFVTTLWLGLGRDLAFAWSSTLDWPPRVIFKLTQVVSTPWRWVWPDAAPTLELIEASRYWRLEQAQGRQVLDPATLARWWPFVLKCTLVWGVLPRAVLLAAVHGMARRSTARAIVRLPGAADVLDRLSRRHVRLQSSEPESARRERSASIPGPSAEVEGSAGRHWAVILWGGAPVSESWARSQLQQRWRSEAERVVHAGGGEDAPAWGDADAAMVIVAARAPQQQELAEHLAAVREALGPGRSIELAVVGVDAARRPAAPRPRDVASWRTWAGSLGDPWMRVVALPSGPMEGGDD